jgi:hypothetical protein
MQTVQHEVDSDDRMLLDVLIKLKAHRPEPELPPLLPRRVSAAPTP